MSKPFSPMAGGNLRQRLIEDMTLRGFGEKRRLARQQSNRQIEAFRQHKPLERWR
jgi:hypothetical protein